MSYLAPIRMKTQYTFNVKALTDSMIIDGRLRILESEDIQKALAHLEKDSYRNRAGYSMSQAVNNICQENDVPVYARSAFLDEVERYQDACIVEGKEVYPSKNVLITWLAKYHSSDITARAPGEKRADAYRRIKHEMKKKYTGNSSHQKAKLINEYESRIAQLNMKKETERDGKLLGDAGPVGDKRVVPRRVSFTPQLSLEF
ncbi:MAG: hypothetical protein JW789_00145 [Candidatus Aenigmarchaeota archaeon]|nr:hypothetical protein [Candidatus Aenigmarchaeota archaeon]